MTLLPPKTHMDLGVAAQGSEPNVDVEEARDNLREVQAALAGLGYQVSNHEDPAHGFDGVWGPQTQQAVAQFQREIGLDVTACLDEDTYDAIVGAHADACAAESGSPTLDDTHVQEFEDVIHRGDHDSVSDQLGEPLD